MAKVYEHRYLPVSMYGNVVALLGENLKADGLHIDVGCGYGPIAEPIRDELKLTYIGFDMASDGCDSLIKRGFACHGIDLRNTHDAEATISSVVGTRTIASISFLDTLEHLVNGQDVISMLRRIAARANSLLVLSVPNITHKDISLKLLTGRWDVTEAGLLDHTHVEFYNSTRLKLLMEAVGWKEIAQKDWLLEQSDQFFPRNQTLLDHRLPAAQFLRRIVESGNPSFLRYQFVRAYRVATPRKHSLLNNRRSRSVVTFNILVATSEDTISLLPRLLDSLKVQTFQDFHLTIVNSSSRKMETYLAGESYDFGRLQGRTTILNRQSPHRAVALNRGLREFDGQYLIVLRPEDCINRDWLAEFASIGSWQSNAVLRVGAKYPTGTKVLQRAILPVTRDMIDAVSTFAIPSGLFEHLNFRFDESMNGGEDIELVGRAIEICGFSQTGEIGVEIGLAGVPVDPHEAEIKRNSTFEAVISKFDHRPTLFPAGTARQIGELLTELEGLGRQEPRESASQMTHVSEVLEPETQTAKPFLSIITRTRGNRMRTLRDTLMSLGGQSSQNFEVFVVVHTSNEAVAEGIRKLIEEFPRSLRTRITVLTCGRAGRSAPLNEAISHLNGQYVAVLDDDDFVFANWVSVFENLALTHPGTVLRATCTRQDFATVERGKEKVPRATSWFKMDWPSHYDAVHHLHSNFSPFMSVAFPTEVLTVSRQRWDESLSTTEDWHFTTRMVMKCGISQSPEVTCVYRWWTDSNSSTFDVPAQEWIENRNRIIEELDGESIVLPPGSTKRICQLFDEREDMKRQIKQISSGGIEVSRLIVNSLNQAVADHGRLRSLLKKKFQASIARTLWKKAKGDHSIIVAALLGPFFDEGWYGSFYPDVSNFSNGPLAHYLLFGIQETRRPGPLFDPHFYLASNADVASSGIEPFVHFTFFGWSEGRPGCRGDTINGADLARSSISRSTDALLQFSGLKPSLFLLSSALDDVH